MDINADTVTNVTSTDFPGHYPGEDHAWDLAKFARNLQVQFHQHSDAECAFSLIGIDASIANAFRRILLAEIPTLAIERVYITSNDSVISDEVLAARLGLVPLTGSAAGLRWLHYFRRKQRGLLGEDSGATEEERDPKDNDTIVLKLKVSCAWREGMRDKRGSPDELYEHSNVYSGDLIFEPQGRQTDIFSAENGPIRPVGDKILLAKLRPGDEIDMILHAVKGVGGDHAKFSPAATASYRLLPTIDIVQPIVGLEAEKFARCFPRGVIGLEKKDGDQVQAVVKDTMKDTVSRECLRHAEFNGKVKLGRVRDHFIFSVESTGQLPSDELFIESVQTLKAKCRVLKAQVANLMR